MDPGPIEVMTGTRVSGPEAPRTRDTLAVALVSMAACSTNLAFLSGHPLFGYPVIDAAWHHGWSGLISGGDLLAYAPFFRAPLYPWLLGIWYAVAGMTPLAGALLSLVLTVSGSMVLHRIAGRIMPRWWALGAGMVWALWGTSVFYSSLLLITPLFTLMLLLSFLLLTGDRWKVLGWLTLGLACVARPTALLLLPAAWFAGGRPGLRGSLAMGAPIAVVWAVNILAGDPGTVLSSQGGINLFLGNSMDSDGYTAFAPSVEEPPGDWSYGEDLPYVDNVEMASRKAFPEMDRGSRISAEWTGRAVSEVFEDPLHWLGLTGMKVLYLVSPIEIPSNYDPYYYRGLSPVIALLLHPPPAALPMLLLWLLLPGAIFSGRAGRDARAAGLFAITLAVGILPFFVTARFRLPLVPFALLWLAARASLKPRRALILAPAGITAGILLAMLTSGTVRSGGVNMPFHDGLAHYAAGDAEKAEDLFVMALDRASVRDDMDLNGTDAMFNLGVIAAEQGDAGGAVFWWTSALERDPRHRASAAALETVTSLDPTIRLE